MQRSDLKEEEYQDLLNRIVPLMLKKGLKSTKMDFVASSLGMSKRTLYEIFDSKEEMIKEVLGAIERQSHDFSVEAFSSSANVMEAMIKIFKYNRDLVGSVNVEFYRDMDRLYKRSREDYENYRLKRHETMLNIFRKGVEEGMFRTDVDYNVQSRIMGVQMEAMKRIEELFPPEITLLQVFDTLIISFLRSIASEKGMKVLDEEIKALRKKREKNR